MNKATYVEKMTDIVEDLLLEKGISNPYTIEDLWEEEDELAMRLVHDCNGNNIYFDLSELYAQKREEDVKLKSQFRTHIKDSILQFIEQENNLVSQTLIPFSHLNPFAILNEEEQEAEYEDDDLDDFDEEDELDEDKDFDEEDEEEIEEDDEYEEDDDLDDDDEYDDEDEYDDDEEDEEKDSFSERVSNLLSPLQFSFVESSAESVMTASLPKDFSGDLEKILKRYGKQISELFDAGCFLANPNGKDVLVFDSNIFDQEEVTEIVKELYSTGGELTVKALECTQEMER